MFNDNYDYVWHAVFLALIIVSGQTIEIFVVAKCQTLTKLLT